jgi:hypothetical protein
MPKERAKDEKYQGTTAGKMISYNDRRNKN